MKHNVHSAYFHIWILLHLTTYFHNIIIYLYILEYYFKLSKYVLKCVFNVILLKIPTSLPTLIGTLILILVITYVSECMYAFRECTRFSTWLLDNSPYSNAPFEFPGNILLNSFQKSNYFSPPMLKTRRTALRSIQINLVNCYQLK